MKPYTFTYRILYKVNTKGYDNSVKSSITFGIQSDYFRYILKYGIRHVETVKVLIGFRPLNQDLTRKRVRKLRTYTNSST